MLAKLAIIALLPVCGAIAFVVAWFLFYQDGSYQQPVSAKVPFENIDTRSVSPGTSEELPTGQLRRGLLVVDAQHSNLFTERELVNFTSRVADRGFDVEFLGSFAIRLDPTKAQSRYLELAEKLRRADSFVVILPRAGYSESEAALVERFVQKGGKLLLFADPGRSHQINSLAKRFGVDFQTDYLYNPSDNDANFRRIFVRDFQPDQLTAGLETITLEYAGSVQSAGGGLAFASPGTRSSLLQNTDELSPIAWGESRNVLAIADFTFLVPTNDSLLDNGRLASNLADYVTDSEREYDLSDFPYFYRSGQEESVDILVGNSGLLNVGLQAKAGLAAYGVSSQISAAEDVSRDTVFLGLYEDASLVGQYLQAAGIRVDDTLGTSFAPELELQNTAVTVLEQGEGRNILIILSDTPATLAGAAARLISGEFRADLVSDFVAIRKFEEMVQ